MRTIRLLKINILVLCFFLISIETNLEARQLYAVLVADTLDASIGTATVSALEGMQNQVNLIAQATDSTLNISLFQGLHTTPEKVLNEIKNLPISQDDIVILYFAMHGSRTPSKKNQWPDLYFGVSQQGVDFHEVSEWVKQKNPSFLLAIADCCNSYIPEGALKMVSMKQLRAMAQSWQEGYRNLFLARRGSLVLTAASPGQYSYAQPGIGGLLSMSFMKKLNEVVFAGQEHSWESILAIVDKDVNDNLASWNLSQNNELLLALSAPPLAGFL